jgi:hypothetical protein
MPKVRLWLGRSIAQLHRKQAVCGNRRQLREQRATAPKVPHIEDQAAVRSAGSGHHLPGTLKAGNGRERHEL